MKYVNIEIISSLVTSIFITLVLYYFNRNDENNIPLKTYLKTCIISALLILMLLYFKKNVLDKNVLNIGNSNPTTTASNYQENIAVGEPNF
tara:strand:+ start:140 stop:412 length:273 start_codon:yes stop_codon:yes gene_type:complete